LQLKSGQTRMHDQSCFLVVSLDGYEGLETVFCAQLRADCIARSVSNTPCEACVFMATGLDTGCKAIPISQLMTSPGPYRLRFSYANDCHSVHPSGSPLMRILQSVSCRLPLTNSHFPLHSASFVEFEVPLLKSSYVRNVRCSPSSPGHDLSVDQSR
jgi:hypothetical protein